MNESERLHHEALVCDLHVDTLQRIALGQSLSGHQGHLDIPRMRRGGLNLQFFAAWVDRVYLPRDGTPDRSFARAIELLDAFDREMRAHAEAIAPVGSAAQARCVLSGGRLVAALGVEGGHAIENDLDKLQELYRRGVRYMTLTWNNTTDWADAAKEETLHGTRHGGLTAFGEEVVRRMNRLGMIVDLSHAAESTFWHVLRISTAPVMASHSNAHALSPHYRNLKDEQIRALAERGGIIGINFYSAFLDAEFSRRSQEAEERCRESFEALEREHAYDYPRLAELGLQLLNAQMGHVPVPASRIADHIEHMVRLVGPDHVALGSDFDGTSALPDDMLDVSCLPLVTRLLHERGFGEAEIRKILGENVLRFFETVCG
ncbi:MAG: dipeptidase [Candidatus Krumholzibacteriia bacterium]